TPFTQSLRQNRAHRSPLHLLGNRVRPVTRLWPVDVAAALPQRAPYTRYTRAPCPLLLPQFFSVTARVAPVLRYNRSRTLVCKVVLHRRMNEPFIQRSSEHRLRQLELTHFFIIQVLYFYDRHRSAPFSTVALKCLPAPFRGLFQQIALLLLTT